MAFKKELVKALKARSSVIKNPEFDLAERRGKVTGFVISETFRGMPQLDRQDLVWDYLIRVFSPEKLVKIIALITVTPKEFRG